MIVEPAFSSLLQIDQRRAKREARTFPRRTAAAGALDHARVTSRRVAGEWLVVFDDANVPRDRLHWPDVYARVDVGTDRVGPAGASPGSLAEKNPCAASGVKPD